MRGRARGSASRSSAGAAPLITLACLALALSGCPRREEAAGADGPARRDAAAPPPASPPTIAFERCTSPGGAAGLKPIMLERYRLVPEGDVLRALPALMSLADKTPITLGVLADTKEALPATLARLDGLTARFKRMGVQAIILLGGVDQSYEGIKAVLERLQRVATVLALPGDRESRSGFSAAAEAFPGRVIDLVKVRAVVLPGLTLVGVPGYHLPHHLLAKEQGCSYDAADLKRIAALGRGLPAPRMLLAHGPPRGAGPLAVDRAFGEINIGDPLLHDLIGAGSFSFGAFGHVHESSGHATTAAGATVAPLAWSDSLLLNVGSADSVPHQDLAGRWALGEAAVIEIKGGRARFRMLELSNTPPPAPPPVEEE